MLTGGIADKVGNEYEVRWALGEALRVLRGLADELRVEPFNEDGEGFEFRVTSNGLDEWHQCKRQRSSGNWTIRGLADGGVLQAFAGKLAAQNARCVFVSSDPAPAFEKLIEKAGIAETADDFYGEGGVGKTDEAPLRELNEAWSVDAGTQFDWLKRCRVEVISEGSSMRQLEGVCDILFKTPPSHAIDRLTRFLTANLGQRLRTARLVQAIGELGIEWRAHFDESLDARANTATDHYLETLSTKIAGLELETEQLRSVADAALDGERPITVLAGGAGSGKSVALSRTIAAARARGWPVLAFRIDRHLDVQTLSELGRAVLDFSESPVIAFGNRTISGPALVVIDQVDAVSEASGRSGRIRDLFFQLVREREFFPGMRLVAACRSYDLDRDTRLKELSEGVRASAVRLKSLDWQDAVSPVLKKLGVEGRSFTPRERDMLSLPINLRLFAEIVESGDEGLGELTSTRLFDRLLEIRGRELRQEGFSWTPHAALGVIAQHMSDNQDLIAPIALLDPFAGAADALSSRGLITAIGGKIQFAHESFFDHTFSRHFLTTGQTVHGLLLGDEQRLFRRTQVRQIFSRLRDNAQRRYLDNLREVMTAGDVRYLVKDAVGYWLSEVETPTAAELALVVDWFTPGHALERVARVILIGPGWLPLLLDNGWIARWVGEGGPKKEFAFWLLNRGAVTRSDAVAAFMNDWLRQDREGRAAELIRWFEQLHPQGPIGSLETLYAKLVEELPIAQVKDDLVANFDLGSWLHRTPALGARVLGLWLRKWMASFPDRHPFSDDRTDNESYWVEELVKQQPVALLEATIAPLSEALIRDQKASDDEGGHPTIRPPHYQHDQQFLRLIIQAVEAVALENPAEAESFVVQVSEQTDAGLFMRLRAIAANGAALKHLLPPLLTHDRVFKVGQGDGDWLPFAAAAAASMPHLDGSDRDKVEKAVLAYRPEYDWAREYSRRAKADELVWPVEKPGEYLLHQLRLAGRDERAILTTIGPAHLSQRAQARLAELDRKFPGEPLPESYGVRGGFVRSPIEPERARFMSDKQWLRAIGHYAGEEDHTYEPDGVIGGARQLASVLQARAKEEPLRFVKLLERLSTDANPAYAEAAVSGLRESEASADVVVRGVKAAWRWPNHDFSRTISWTIQRHPRAGSDPAILKALLTDAETAEASDTIVRTTNPGRGERRTAREILGENDDLTSSGMNGERGSAYEALANVLWEDRSALPAIIALLERQVENEPLASVRICMAHTIHSIGKYDPAKSVALLERLVRPDLRVLRGHAAGKIMSWAAHDYPNVVAAITADLLQAQGRALRALGHFNESLLALLHEERNAAFVAGFSDSQLRRQMAAFRGSGNITSKPYGDRALGWLLALFNDEDAAVRGEMVHIDWADVLDKLKNPAPVVRAYIASASFNDQSDRLMRALEGKVSQFPELTFEAVEKVLELSAGWTEERRRGHFSTLHHLGRLLVELYRSAQGGSTREKRILDLFDLYLARDQYDLRGEIGAYERH